MSPLRAGQRREIGEVTRGLHSSNDRSWRSLLRCDLGETSTSKTTVRRGYLGGYMAKLTYRDPRSGSMEPRQSGQRRSAGKPPLTNVARFLADLQCRLRPCPLRL